MVHGAQRLSARDKGSTAPVCGRVVHRKVDGQLADITLLWGLLAGSLGLVATFLLAAALMAAGVATMCLWPLIDTRGLDRSRAVYWPEPQLTLAPDPDSEPVVVRPVHPHRQPDRTGRGEQLVRGSAVAGLEERSPGSSPPTPMWGVGGEEA